MCREEAHPAKMLIILSVCMQASGWVALLASAVDLAVLQEEDMVARETSSCYLLLAIIKKPSFICGWLFNSLMGFYFRIQSRIGSINKEMLHYW